MIKKSLFLNDNINLRDYFIALVIFYTNLTYIPYVTNIQYVNIITPLLWILMAITIIHLDIKLQQRVFPYVIFTIVFDLFIIFAEIFISNNYLDSRFVYPVNMCLFAVLIGIGISKFVSSKQFSFYIKAYLLSSFLLGIIVYEQYYSGADWLNSMEYIVVQKNGIAMIFAVSILCILYSMNISFNKYLYLPMFLSYSFLLLVLKSRAVIAGLIIAIAYFIFTIKYQRKYLVLFLIGVICSALFLYTNIFDYFVYNVLFNNRYNMGWDAVSSDRISHLEIFISEFGNNIFCGHGTFYLESFPLAALMSYGIIGFLPLLILSMLPIISSITSKNGNLIFKDFKLSNFLCSLWILFFTNGIFEELAPFGPGVKCYFLWLICGIVIGNPLKMRN